MGVNIDELQIEVSTESDKAEKNIDRLSKIIDKLQKSTENCKGLTRLKNQMSKMADVAERLNRINLNTSQTERLVSTINSLNDIQTPNFTKLKNQTNKLSNIVSKIDTMPDISAKLESFISAVRPFETLGRTNINAYLKSLERIPEISEKLKSTDLKDFSASLKNVASAIEPLATQMEKLGSGYAALPANIKSVVSNNQQLVQSNSKVVASHIKLSDIVGKVKLKIAVYSTLIRNLSKVLGECFNESNDYIENLNLFEVAMGKGAKAALEYGETVNDVLGIDTSEWIRNQGVFKQITTGFGVANDKANLMSKNLTQLGYDISSFFNIGTEESMQKLQSGISGELEPLRRLGYALDTATLQQVAYGQGINESINKMTQAQKSQLRYLAIMQQSSNAMGDMARTVITPANSLRILDQQFTQLKRAIGNVVSVIAVKLIPYIQVAVRLLTDLANYLANKWGFELPKIDYSNVSDGLSTVTDNADEATEKVKETVKEMQRLAGFDELNILQRDQEDSSEKDKSDEGNSNWNFQLPEYDFLTGADKSTDELYKKAKKKIKDIIAKLKDLKDWVKENINFFKRLGTLIAGIWTVKKLLDFIKWIKELWGKVKQLKIFNTAKDWVKNFISGFKSTEGSNFFKKLNGGIKKFRDHLSPVTRALGTIAGTALASHGSYNLFYDLAKDTGDWKSVLFDSAEIVAGLGMSWIFGGVPGLAFGTIVTAFAGLYGYIKACDEEHEKLEDDFMNSHMYNNGGVKISSISDAFKNMKSDLEKGLKPIQDLQTEIDNTNEKIDSDQFFVTKYNQKLSEAKELNEIDVKEMKGHFDGLISNMKKNLKDETDLVYEAFHNSAVDAGKQLNIDVGQMEIILDKFKSKYSSKLDKLNAEQDVFFEKMTKGGLSESEMKKFQDNLQYIADLNHVYSDSEFNFNSSVKDIDNIDFENENAAKKAIEEINSSVEGMIDDIAQVNKDAQKSLEDLKYKAKVMYEHGDISEGYYKNLCKSFDKLSQSIDKAYSDKKQEIMNQYGTVMSAIELEFEKYMDECIEKNGTQLGDKAKSVWNNFTNVFGSSNLFAVSNAIANYKSDVDIAKERLTEKYESYFKISDKLADEYSKKSYESTGKRFLNILHETGVESALEYAKGIDSKKDAIDESIMKIQNSMRTYFNQDLGGYTFGSNFVKTIKEGMESAFPALDEATKNLRNSMTDGLLATITIAGNAMLASKGNHRISGFASGGYPVKGQLFYARENGIPEMVGAVGNQTAVANNQQIEDGIADGVYKAVRSAMSSAGGGEAVTIPVTINIEGQKIEEVMYKYEQRQVVRSNGMR